MSKVFTDKELDTFVRRRPTLDSIPSTAVYRAVYGAGHDSAIILSYDTLPLEAFEPAVRAVLGMPVRSTFVNKEPANG